MVNTAKSSFTSCHRLSPNRQRIISSVTGFRQESLPISYLGIQLYKGHGRNFLFEPLINKIRDGMASWQGKFLSIVGRITLYLREEVLALGYLGECVLSVLGGWTQREETRGHPRCFYRKTMVEIQDSGDNVE
ncbi:hypothetical protein LIER_15694 [Lithospermum erythrorhizon]|uniref:Uncharacterized protein n=1 Tax=Lithospermum erythrorhizon TaxID=34254 RepID=A0AAV3Q3U1_LITER